ncbi:MAG: DUF616 domain-containing protein [Planctomycetia bacterium]|nr:DUF616 domain-containing protein [Planctomycetia bacterium]
MLFPSLATFEKRLQYLNDKILVLQSGLWDENYYLSQSKDIRLDNMEPLDHYLQIGWKLGYEPSEYFSGKDYYREIPSELGIGAFIYYLRYDRWKPYPVFNRNIFPINEEDIRIYREKKSQRHSKKVVYTCITNNYDDLHAIRAHRYIAPEWDYVCFTDNPEVIAQKTVGIWEVRPLVVTNLDYTRQNRYHKILPHRIFPEYDESIYIDANINILSPWVFERIKEMKTDFVLPQHALRTCIYQEMEEVRTLGWVDNTLAEEQLQAIRKSGIPYNYGLSENRFLYRKHHKPQMVSMMEEWWQWLIQYTQRDQLSLMPILWRNTLQLEKYTFPSTQLQPQNFLIFRHTAQVLNDKIK